MARHTPQSRLLKLVQTRKIASESMLEKYLYYVSKHTTHGVRCHGMRKKGRGGTKHGKMHDVHQ